MCSPPCKVSGCTTTVSELNVFVAARPVLHPVTSLQPWLNQQFWTNFVGKEISRPSNSNSVLWLVVITIVQIYIEKEEEGQKEKYRMYSLRRKRA